MQNQPKIIKFIRYRPEGNCFVNCFIQACVNLENEDLKKNEKPELEIFNIETLHSDKSATEFKPALNYFISCGYKVKIIDPEPCRDNNWGNNLKKADVKIGNYEVKDVLGLSGQSWEVIISTVASGKPHAVLVTKSQIYDPINEPSWKSPKARTKQLVSEYADREKKRFLIAVKKG